MNRIQYIFLTALLILSGCEKNSLQDIEVGNTSNSYIFFDAAVMETKGLLLDDTGLPNAAGTDFGVFGFRPSATADKKYGDKLFTSSIDMSYVARVYRASDGAAFSYTNLEIWHPGEHDFYAFYPYDIRIVTYAGMPILVGEKPNISYTQPQTLDGMFDLMTAKAENQTSSNPIVQLNFEHRLFAFDFVLKNNQAVRPLEVTRAEIKFFNVGNQATLYYDGTENDISTYTNIPSTDGASLSLITSGSNLQLNAGQEHNFNKISGTDTFNSFLFLPCQTLNVQIKLTFKNAWNETITYEPAAIALTPKDENGNNTTFLAGHKYTLTITKSDDSITFDPIEPTDWETKDIPLTFN